MLTADFTLQKLPPQNIEAEQMVLGAVLLENACLDSISDVLAPADFYKDAHRSIYAAMQRMNEQRMPVDLITLTDTLRGDGSLEKIGGASYLSVLVSLVPTAANAEAHARIVRDKALIRNMIKAAISIETQGYAEPQAMSADEYLDQSEQAVFQVGQGRSASDTFVSARTAAAEAFESIEHRYENRGTLPGISTGFPDLDRMTQGLCPGDLVIIAGRPSMGKTALALNIGGYAAIELEKTVGVFSLEMTRNQLTQRLIASEGRVSGTAVRSGHLQESDWGKIGMAAGRIAEAPLWIDETPALAALDIRSRSRRLKAQHGLDMIIVDYLQLMRGAKNADNREQEISGITRALKGLAKELAVPVIALSQLNRGLEQRQNKRPALADLRESGAIEQDADVIMFIYREEVYNECKCPPLPNGVCTCERRGAAEVIIGKQRNGPTGVVPMVYRKEYTRFESRA